MGVFAQREGDVVADVQRVEQRAHLEKKPEPLADVHDVALAQRVDPVAVEPDFPRVRL